MRPCMCEHVRGPCVLVCACVWLCSQICSSTHSLNVCHCVSWEDTHTVTLVPRYTPTDTQACTYTDTHACTYTHTHTCTEPGTKSLVRLTESFRLLDSNHVSLKLKTSLTQGTASSFALPHLLDTRHSSYLLSLSPPSPSILPWKRKASDVGIFQDTHRELLSER